MSTSTEPDLSPLVEALRWYDDHSRDERARRIAWASALYQAPGVVAGRMVPLHLMEEARVSFVNGQFMTVVISAAAVIEHLLVDDLESSGVQGDRGTFAAAIRGARTAGMLPAPLLDGVDGLRKHRNSFVHRNADAGPYSLADRYRRHAVHPATLLEADAQAALKLMYELFIAILKRA